MYTTQLQAGLGLVDETRLLLDLWQPGMSTTQLHADALASGLFSNVTARRLRNIVAECFAPRYLVDDGEPAAHLKRLSKSLTSEEFRQFLFIFTSRANDIVADFVREVYWQRYAGGYSELTKDDAVHFVRRAIDDGKTSTRWSETTVKRVSGYVLGVCGDFGLLESATRGTRRFANFRIAPATAAYLAHDLHFRGVGDTALIRHSDWQLFGLEPSDVVGELKRLGLRGLIIVQAAHDLVQISWKFKSMEELCDALVD